MLAGARWFLAATAIASVASPLCPSSALAQASATCGYGNRLLRSAVGGSLGGWAGLVAMKIRYSDWNDASRSVPGIRARNQGIVVGAILGLSLGNLRFRAACRPVGLDVSPPRSPARSPITTDEIQRSGVSGSVYDLVYTLRKSWLNTRGIDALSEGPMVFNSGGQEVIVVGEPKLLVYLDNLRLGTIAELHKMAIGGVTGVRYYDGAEATNRWGAGHTHGAIQVLTVTEGSR